MDQLLSLTKRNMLMFLKNRAALFFSLFSMLIILMLYILFLAKMNVDTVQSMVEIERNTAAYLVNSWVMAGIIVVNSVTVTLGVTGIMVEDEVMKRIQVFLVSPVSRVKLTLGYILSSFIIGIALCLVTLILSEVYIVACGGLLLTFNQILEVIGIIMISVFSATCFVFLIISFVRTTSTFTSLSIITGSVIGFAAGLYVPFGVLPETVKNILKFLPIFYGSSLIRGVFVSTPVSTIFRGIPDDAASGWLQSMGVEINWGIHAVTVYDKIGIIISSGIIFLLLSAILMKRRKMAQA